MLFCVCFVYGGARCCPAVGLPPRSVAWFVRAAGVLLPSALPSRSRPSCSLGFPSAVCLGSSPPCEACPALSFLLGAKPALPCRRSFLLGAKPALPSPSLLGRRPPVCVLSPAAHAVASLRGSSWGCCRLASPFVRAVLGARRCLCGPLCWFRSCVCLGRCWRAPVVVLVVTFRRASAGALLWWFWSCLVWAGGWRTPLWLGRALLRAGAGALLRVFSRASRGAGACRTPAHTNQPSNHSTNQAPNQPANPPTNEPNSQTASHENVSLAAGLHTVQLCEETLWLQKLVKWLSCTV